ncbi:GntR family transcriptional regulator [Tengunoibacter tsumagoiensis]|uniref:HTH gntR-type domain-containing protein n=1 Tax=Tengunoibacter tsumagoiensis TaxID=2014871 RepID=A0A402A2X6_9CHLR|nr:GntR family transcriptional regulator [Tengunoibacter tsumagoiensis]GCE13497.1 hypothetical protein KTT_33560 [Tengunoibacter tsumagoiensis]
MTVPRLCQNVRELALQMEPGQKLPTVNELCARFGTSRATLDEALSRLEQQHVIERKHSKGIFVSDKIHRKTILVLFDASLLAQQRHSPFWGELWHMFAQEAQSRVQRKNEYHSIHLVLRTADKQALLPEGIADMMEANLVHGLLVIGMSDYEWSEHGEIPCVTFAGYDRWMVAFDQTQFALMTVKVLAEQRCHSIGIWSPRIMTADGPELPSFHDYQACLNVFGLPFYPELARTVSPEFLHQHPQNLSFSAQGYAVAMEVFRQPSPPLLDGLIVTDDMFMEGVLAAFHQLGIKIGEEIKVATHANTGSMLIFNNTPGLTVVEFDPAEIVQKMFTVLDTLMAGQKPAEAVTRVVPKLRGSTNIFS